MVLENQVGLRRELGLIGAVSYIVGNTVGSGIFISPKVVLEATGSVGLCLTVWVLAGVLQIGVALCYAELGTALPVSGGAYAYIRKAFGNYPAFLNAMRLVLFHDPGALVVMLLTSSQYILAQLAPGCGPRPALEKLVAFILLVALFAINAYSTRLAARVAIVTTAVKLLAVAIIIIGGVVSLAYGWTDRSELDTGFAGTSRDPATVALAMYAANFAYSGSQMLNRVVEEVKDPQRTIPRAAVIGVVIVIVVNTLSNAAYLAVLSRQDMLTSQAVGVDFGYYVLPSVPWILPMAVCVSTIGSAFIEFHAGSRLVFAAARDRNVPEALCYIQVNRLTPLCAMMATSALATIMMIPSDISSLVSYMGFLKVVFEACVFASLIVFRLRKDTAVNQRKPSSRIRIPLAIPVVLIVVQLYMFLAPLVISPRVEYVYTAAGLFGGSSVLYLLFIHHRLSIPLYDRVIKGMQFLLKVSPPSQYIR